MIYSLITIFQLKLRQIVLWQMNSPTKLQRTQFICKFGKLENSYKLIFMQDEAPAHWFTNVMKWLNENFPRRGIGRGGSQDCNITWPTKSPVMTPMTGDFLWKYIKSKVCVKNYENISDLKTAIISAIQEVSDGMVTSTMENFGIDDWKWSFGIREGILKNIVVMCLSVVYIKILMSVHFEHKLMKIGRIELEIFKF